MSGVRVLLLAALLTAVPAVPGAAVEPAPSVALGVGIRSVDELPMVAELAGDGPFTVRLEIGWDDPPSVVKARRNAAVAAGAEGWDVHVALRYRPPPDAFPDPSAFAAWTAQTAAALASVPRLRLVVGERPNSAPADPGSDAGHPLAVEAAVAGVVAAAAAAPAVPVGLSWLASGLEAVEQAAFLRLGALGGPALAGAVDLLEVHLYPGTFAAGASPGEPFNARQMANEGLREVRRAMPLAGFGLDVPIVVGEFAFPVAEERLPVVLGHSDLEWVARHPDAQARALRDMLTGIQDVVRAAGVTAALWAEVADAGRECDLLLCFGLADHTRDPRPAYDALYFAQRSRRA